jgi:hypothetical protein
MIVRSARFLDLHMPPEFAHSWITPVRHCFVRNRMPEPTALDVDEWRLTISGDVEKPLTLSLAPWENATAYSDGHIGSIMAFLDPLTVKQVGTVHLCRLNRLRYPLCSPRWAGRSS